jgi:hypothetical protein
MGLAERSRSEALLDVHPFAVELDDVFRGKQLVGTAGTRMNQGSLKWGPWKTTTPTGTRAESW